MKLLKSASLQILLAIGAGIAIGHYYPDFGQSLKPFGDAFIKGIKMLVGPIIFCTVVTGIAGMSDMKKAGKTGAYALLYFEVMSVIALLLGLAAAHLLLPGVGMNIDPGSLDIKSVAQYVGPGKMPTATDFFLNLIPSTFVEAFARGELLQVLLVSVLFGYGLQLSGGQQTALFGMIETATKTFLAMINVIMKTAWIGALGAMAFTIGKYGLASLGPLLKLLGSFYLTVGLFILIFLGSLARYCGFSLFKLIGYIKEEVMVVFATASSETALARLMEKLEILGVKKSCVGLVIPTGYTMNLDGSYIFLSLACIFLAQATNTPLTFTQEAILILVLMFTSKGAAAVTGSGFIALAATIGSVGDIPVASVGIILGVYRFISSGMATTNLIGNSVATILIAKWTGELNQEQLKNELQ